MRLQNPFFQLCLFCCLLLQIAACSYSDEWTVREEDNFTINLPPFTTSMEGKLNADAALEIGNYYRNYYLIVLEYNELLPEQAFRREMKALKSNDNFAETEVYYLGPKKNEETGEIVYYAHFYGEVGQDGMAEEITYHMNFYKGKNMKTVGLIQWYWTSKEEILGTVTQQVIADFKVK